ncbi:Testin-2 [Thelohanellus kitauei]|uniref:Testin-2 n=1 Tax=Thelohanellus kitauei TaxID=669202 RepID=A0A0C2JPR2_THEKT|nr:Testin-2 [Thelohanellus kitauei]
MNILLISVLVLVSHQDEFDKFNVDIKWERYKLTYSLTFDEEEDQLRKEIFIKNYRFIEEHNAKRSQLKLKMNKFGHLREDEVLMNNVFTKSTITKSHQVGHIGDLPVRKSIDWRTFGVVSPVKNELNCRCSHAFSVIGAIESHYAIQKGYLPLLSEQEIVDCAVIYHSRGCSGGQPVNVYDWAADYGLLNQSFYPYTGKEGTCRSKRPVPDYRIKSFVNIPSRDEKQMIRILSFKGPLSITMDAAFPEFTFYSSGIINSTRCGKIYTNRVVLAVGYNLTGEPYYIVKNSWGTDWGEDGYFRIKLGVDMCGITLLPSYPLV